MIFVLESYLKSRRDKIEAWEEARDNWVNEDKDKYYYRNNQDWAKKHPYPVFRWNKFVEIALPVLLVLFLAGGVTALTLHHTSTPSNTKHTTQTTQKKTSFKVGDKVQVVYGDYEDSTGVIVRINGNDAIIKLTNSTLTTKMCNASSSCESGGGKDDGQLLDVSSLSNLVAYKDVKNG